MEENSNDIEKLKAMIKENFEEQRKLISKLETALEAVTSFNGKQMLDSRDMRLMLKVCDRTLLGLGRTQVPERRMPERRFYV